MINSEHYDSMNNNYQCRICLEDDDISNLIYPCRCSGTSKYVHKTCLNEWRTTSENTDNFDRCELCHYTYVIVPNNDPELCCANKYRRLLRHPILFYGLYFLSLVALAQFIAFCDNYKIKNEMNDEDISPLYFFISTSILLCLQLLTILYWFIRVKNKKLYCELYSSKKELITGSILVAIFTAIIFGWLFGVFLMQLLAFRMFQIHFYSIDNLERANRLDIVNYSEDEPTEVNPLSNEINEVDV